MSNDDQEKEEITVREDDILGLPIADSFEDIIDMISDPMEDESQIRNGEKEIKDLISHDRPTLPDPMPLVQQPFSPPDVTLTNDPNKVLSVNVHKGSVLQKYVGNPIENDPLVETIRSEAPVSSLLNAIMLEVAEEAAFIKAWRNENWNGEADLSEATGKRVRMLLTLVETLSQREKLKKEKNVGKIDFHGENFQKVLKHFMETIMETFRKVHIPPEYEKIFISQLSKEFDGFEKTAEKIYYGKE